MKFLNISIQSLPHGEQRYDTCGDYFQGRNNHTLLINVSQLKDKREMILVAIHELCEWAICDAKGITIKAIDAFDLGEGRGLKEPGDHPHAPYYHGHQIASGIERILAAELGVDWQSYCRHIDELHYNQPVEPLKGDK